MTLVHWLEIAAAVFAGVLTRDVVLAAIRRA
jgi:hypothetical protein